ncbi:MAG: hypothetical protein U9N44_00355 [Chloroflexota bacterium]|nr:hypothetical protein [Chloroflexota bacterium]
MRAVAAGIALVCGIAVLAGVFLPWLGVSGSVGLLDWSYTVSGWDVIDTSGWDVSEFVLSTNLHAVLVLIGAVAMIVAGLSAFILSLTPRSARAGAVALGLLAALSGAVVIGGLAWCYIEISDKELTDYITYGAYVCLGGGVLGFIFGIIATFK